MAVTACQCYRTYYVIRSRAPTWKWKMGQSISIYLLVGKWTSHCCSLAVTKDLLWVLWGWWLVTRLKCLPNKYLWNLFTPKVKARTLHNCSQFLLFGLRESEANTTGRSDPSGKVCKRTAPTPYAKVSAAMMRNDLGSYAWEPEQMPIFPRHDRKLWNILHIIHFLFTSAFRRWLRGCNTVGRFDSALFSVN